MCNGWISPKCFAAQVSKKSEPNLPSHTYTLTSAFHQRWTKFWIIALPIASLVQYTPCIQAKSRGVRGERQLLEGWMVESGRRVRCRVQATRRRLGIILFFLSKRKIHHNKITILLNLFLLTVSYNDDDEEEEEEELLLHRWITARVRACVLQCLCVLCPEVCVGWIDWLAPPPVSSVNQMTFVAD